MKAAAYGGDGAGVHVFSNYGCFARWICDHCVLYIGTVRVQAGEVWGGARGCLLLQLFVVLYKLIVHSPMGKLV